MPGGADNRLCGWTARLGSRRDQGCRYRQRPRRHHRAPRQGRQRSQRDVVAAIAWRPARLLAAWRGQGHFCFRAATRIARSFRRSFMRRAARVSEISCEGHYDAIDGGIIWRDGNNRGSTRNGQPGDATARSCGDNSKPKDSEAVCASSASGRDADGERKKSTAKP